LGIFLSGVVLLTVVLFISKVNSLHIWWVFLSFELLFLVTVTDIQFGIIPNRILAIWTAIWFFLVLITRDLQLFSNLIPAASIILLIFMINQAAQFMIKKEGFGNGDLKLLGILALFFGWEIFWIFYLAIIIGGLYSGILVTLKRKELSSKIVFAPMILLGVLLNALGINFVLIFQLFKIISI
jgi:Flp pilus assembly protein protease CpaA